MEFDVAIVGGGPAGLALAAALRDTALSVAVIDRAAASALADPADDGREIALTRHSVNLLASLDAWRRIPPASVAPLREAQVLNGPSAYAMRLDPAVSARADGSPLGRFVPNAAIRRALHEVAIAEGRATLLDGARVDALRCDGDRRRLALADGRAVSARLVVLADGRMSPSRTRAGIGARVTRFGQTMVVCRMRHERPHRGISTAWFDYGRTLSILPLNGQRCSAVLALPEDEAASLLALDAAGFSSRVTRLFGARLGPMTKDGAPHAVPVVTTYADRFVAPRLALVGDAAVGMHPVTAHGFNLGLAGIDTLAGLVRQAAARGQEIGADGLLGRYEQAHRRATWVTYQATSAIVRLYGTDALPARVLRDAGLRLGNTLPFLRRTVMAKMMEA